MKITLQTSEIQKFISLANYGVAPTPASVQILPISEYILCSIKNGFCKLNITSNIGFVQYMFSADVPDNTFLLSFFLIQKLLKNSKSANITITDKKISDGITNIGNEIPDTIIIQNFPSQPVYSGTKAINIDQSVINKLKISKKYISTDKSLHNWYIYSLLKDGFMLSSDGCISAMVSNSGLKDSMIFSLQEIGLISNFESFSLINLPNWNIIKYKTVVFGNKLVEFVGGLDALSGIFTTINQFISFTEKNKVLKINVEQFYDFCKSVKDFSKDDTICSSLTVVDSGVKMEYNDISNRVVVDRIISCNNIGYELGYKIMFIQEKIMKVLDSLSQTNINLSEVIMPGGLKNQICFWLEEDPTFHSICSKGYDDDAKVEIGSNDNMI